MMGLGMLDPSTLQIDPSVLAAQGSAMPMQELSQPNMQIRPENLIQALRSKMGRNMFPMLGADQQGMNPAQVDQARKTAMMQMGLGMLSNVGQGKSFGQGLGNAFQMAQGNVQGAMQQAYQNARANKADTREQQQIADQAEREKVLDERYQAQQDRQLEQDKFNQQRWEAEQGAAQDWHKTQAQLEREQMHKDIAKASAAASNPMLAGGAGAAGGPSGDEFLKTLPSNIGAQVKALAEGRMAFPSGFALKSPYWQQMLTAVSQYDPNFDAVNYNARSKTRNDFTSGKNAQNLKALNTAIGHLGTLNDQIAGTASHGLTPLNYVQNLGNELTGDAGPTQFKQTASALASELTQVFRGSGGAEADVKRYLSELDVNASKAQKQAAVKNIVDLLSSRTSAIGDQYNQGMGTTADPLTLLNPKARAVLENIASTTGGAKSPNVGLGQAAIAQQAQKYYD